MTPDERRLLPPICQGESELDKQRRMKILGPHKMHFCHGFKNIIRANRSMGDRSRMYLNEALNEFEYVLWHSKKENKNGRYNNIIAMTSIERGKVYYRLNQSVEAIQMYYQAIKYNPKLPQAYAGLSDIYLDLGQDEDAHKVLETGLKQAPKSKSLKRRIEKLSKQK